MDGSILIAVQHKPRKAVTIIMGDQTLDVSAATARDVARMLGEAADQLDACGGASPDVQEASDRPMSERRDPGIAEAGRLQGGEVVMTIDVKKLFDVDLPAALAKNPARVRRELDGIFILTISGAGAWIVRATPQEVSCKRLESPTRADVSITIRQDAFLRLLASPAKAYTVMQLSMSGQISIEGPQATAIRLEKLLALVGL